MLKNLVISSLLSCSVASGSINRFDTAVNNPDMRYYYKIGSFNEHIKTTEQLIFSVAPLDYAKFTLYIDMTYNFEFELYVDRTEQIDTYNDVYYKIINLYADYTVYFFDVNDGFDKYTPTYSTYGGLYVQPSTINYHNYINDKVSNIDTTLFTIDDLIDNTEFIINFSGIASSYIEINASIGTNEKVRVNLNSGSTNNPSVYDYNGLEMRYWTDFNSRHYNLYENTKFYDDISFYVTNFDPSLLYDGYQDGYDVGYTLGSKEGYANGYIQGTNDALTQDVTISTIFNGIFGISLLPINMFLTMFNFEVLGINISGLVSALLTVATIIIIFKFIFGNKSSGGTDKGS